MLLLQRRTSFRCDRQIPVCLVQLDIDPSGTDLEKNLSKNSRFLENKQEIMANNLFLILEKVMLIFEN